MGLLTEGATALGIDLTPGQIAQIDQFGAAILDANQHLNLTRITAPDDVERLHFLDSLTAALPLLPRLQAGEQLWLMDVGTGAGLPGVALKIAFPALHVTLLESTGKKATFLRGIVEQFHWDDVEVVAERAETAGRDERFRDQYDWVTARAVAPLPVVVEICAPFLSTGGFLVAHRRGDLDADVEHAAVAFAELKLWARRPQMVDLPTLADGRGLVIGEKYARTPERYPRRPGIPAKRPLGA